MLPLSGLLIALFVGYAVKPAFINLEMHDISPIMLNVWLVSLRYIATVAISAVFVMGLYDKFFS